MLNLNNYNYSHEPFPYVICKNIFDDNIYSDLTQNFPNIELFKDLSLNDKNKFKKYCLSKRNNNINFSNFISSNSTYNKFYKYINSQDFKEQLINEFLGHKLNIDFGIKLKKKNNLKKIIKDLLNLKWPLPEQNFKITMEFSSLPTGGGFLAPHNDGTDKLTSIVIPIINKEEENFFRNGTGSTSLLEIKDKNKIFNVVNNTYKFDDVNIVKNINFERNNMLIFFKTYNSLHAVYPIEKHETYLERRSITINIEKKYNL